MSNFVDDFIAKINDLNKKDKKEMIKKIIDGQHIGSFNKTIFIVVCDGKEDCMKVVGYDCTLCDFCDKKYCFTCSNDIDFVFCARCYKSSCQLRDCPTLSDKLRGYCEYCYNLEKNKKG